MGKGGKNTHKHLDCLLHKTFAQIGAEESGKNGWRERKVDEDRG